MLKCKHCETETDSKGNPFKSSGGLRLHEFRCKKNPEYEKNIKHVDEVKEESTTDCPECGGALKLLNPKYKAHQRCMDDGYNMICDNCKEVVQ